MILSFTLLLVVTFLSGLIVYLIPKWKGEQFNLVLIFSGSYLFGITVVHILPELFDQPTSRGLVGSLILAGFFFQIFLEYFTSGVEHGHVHSHNHKQSHTLTTSVSMLIALCLHSFMEGTLLAHPSTIHAHHESNALLVGILIHKIPAAFALMSIVTCHFKTLTRPLLFLFLFSIASPLGLLVSDSLVHEEIISPFVYVILFAIVSGSFLKISTTIFFESNPEHKFGLKKIIVSCLGAAIALLADSFL